MRSAFARLEDYGAGAPIPDMAFESSVKAMRRLATQSDVVLAVSVGKDVTERDFFSDHPEESWTGKLAGRSGRFVLESRLQSLNISQEEHWRLESSDGYEGRLFGGFVDLWSVTLRHRLVWLAICYLSRYLSITQPLFIRAYSSKVSCNLVGYMVDQS